MVYNGNVSRQNKKSKKGNGKMKLGKRIVGILLAAVMLCSAFTVCSSASGDYGSSFDTATTLTWRGVENAFVVYDCSLETSGDEDYFKFTAPESGIFLIYTEGATDTIGYLYDSSRKQLAYNDDNDGINFAIKYSLVKGNTYYVKVTAYGSTTGIYDLYVNAFATSIVCFANEDARSANIDVFFSGYFSNATLYIGGRGYAVSGRSSSGFVYDFLCVNVPATALGSQTTFRLVAQRGSISVSETYSNAKAVYYSTSVLTGITGAKTTLSSLIASEKINGYTVRPYTADGTLITDTSVKSATGMVLATFSNTNGRCYKAKFVVLFGDVDGDGEIKISDSIAILKHISGQKTLTGAALLAADVNHDGVIDEADNDLVQKVVANWDIDLGQSTAISSVPASLTASWLHS